ncbi:chromate transporter [Vogesella sp. LIG4]|uniref:chromate transporter n=1 Tax=Vogesella sp. LIG4 TaxID=1192162 RepID=UPI0008202239|nr:chromate transporter [Vogesella sp. LIG4]SCK06473.1 chromate transporter [Vogesella sp. LIG4]
MTTLVVPDRRALFAGFFMVGLSGFGGVLPHAQHMLVERRRWLSQQQFAEMLGLGQVLPGPNIVNVAVAVGARFHGASGALAACGGLLLAPLGVVLLLASVYASYQQLPLVQGLLRGLGPTAIGLIFGMALKLAARLPRRVLPWLLLLATFVAVAIWQLPLLPVLLLLATLGIAASWFWPGSTR